MTTNSEFDRPLTFTWPLPGDAGQPVDPDLELSAEFGLLTASERLERLEDQRKLDLFFGPIAPLPE